MTPTKTIAILRRLADDWRHEELQLCKQFGDVITPQSMRARRIKDTEAIYAAVEMIQRLEVAESECLEESRLNGMGSEREAALMAKLEAAEKERDAAELMSLALRAKIEQMEKQEPVAWYSKQYGFVYMSRQPSQFEHGSILYLRNGAPAWRIEGSSKVALLDIASLPHGTVFYALPGARGEEK